MTIVGRGTNHYLLGAHYLLGTVDTDTSADADASDAQEPDEAEESWIRRGISYDGNTRHSSSMITQSLGLGGSLSSLEHSGESSRSLTGISPSKHTHAGDSLSPAKYLEEGLSSMKRSDDEFRSTESLVFNSPELLERSFDVLDRLEDNFTVAQMSKSNFFESRLQAKLMHNARSKNDKEGAPCDHGVWGGRTASKRESGLSRLEIEDDGFFGSESEKESLLDGGYLQMAACPYSPLRESQRNGRLTPRSRHRSVSADKYELSKYKQQPVAEESFEERLKKKMRESSSKYSQGKERGGETLMPRRRMVSVDKYELSKYTQPPTAKKSFEERLKKKMSESSSKDLQEKGRMPMRLSASMDNCKLSKYKQLPTAKESFEERLKKKMSESSSNKSQEKRQMPRHRLASMDDCKLLKYKQPTTVKESLEECILSFEERLKKKMSESSSEDLRRKGMGRMAPTPRHRSALVDEYELSKNKQPPTAKESLEERILSFEERLKKKMSESSSKDLRGKGGGGRAVMPRRRSASADDYKLLKYKQPPTAKESLEERILSLEERLKKKMSEPSSKDLRGKGRGGRAPMQRRRSASMDDYILFKCKQPSMAKESSEECLKEKMSEQASKNLQGRGRGGRTPMPRRRSASSDAYILWKYFPWKMKRGAVAIT